MVPITQRLTREKTRCTAGRTSCACRPEAATEVPWCGYRSRVAPGQADQPSVMTRLPGSTFASRNAARLTVLASGMTPRRARPIRPSLTSTAAANSTFPSAPRPGTPGSGPPSDQHLLAVETDLAVRMLYTLTSFETFDALAAASQALTEVTGVVFSIAEAAWEPASNDDQ